VYGAGAQFLKNRDLEIATHAPLQAVHRVFDAVAQLAGAQKGFWRWESVVRLVGNCGLCNCLAYGAFFRPA
jgi:hypothetical protein